MSEHYVVQSGEYSGRGIEGVFDTFDEAVELVVKAGWDDFYDTWAADISVWDGRSGRGRDVPADHPLVTGALRALATERDQRQRARQQAREEQARTEREERERRMAIPRLFLTCEVQPDGTVVREVEKEIRVGDSPLDGATASSWFLPGGSVVVQAHGTDFERTRKAYQDRVAETRAVALGLTGE